MRTDRLLRLADLLEANAKAKRGAKFDLDSWVQTRNKNAPVSCGTTACAIGLAAISGEFEKDGFGYSLIKVGGWFNIEPQFLGSSSWAAVTALFEITERQAHLLFTSVAYPDGYTKGAKGERRVAQRIRDVVEWYERS